MKPETIARALEQATTEQIRAEWTKRLQAMLKVESRGSNSDKPRIDEPKHCGAFSHKLNGVSYYCSLPALHKGSHGTNIGSAWCMW